MPSLITSPNALTEAAGVSIGPLTSWFPIKLVLIEGIMRRHLDDMLDCQLSISGAAHRGSGLSVRVNSLLRGLVFNRTNTLIDRPDTGRGNFQQMPVGIAKVYALATQIPRALLFDSDSILFKPCFPPRQFGSRNREGDVQFAISIVR